MANCSVCLENLRQPTTCIPCGHMFCYQCINYWCQRDSNTTRCPACRCNIQQLQKVFLGDPSKFVINESKENGEVKSNKIQWFHDQYDSLWFRFKRLQDWRRRYYAVTDYDEEDGEDDILTIIDHLQHHTERLKASWRDLHTSQKLMLSFGVLLIIALVIQDAQNSYGFLNGLILPVLTIILDFTWSLTQSVAFVFIRPLFCLWNVFAEIFITMFEVVYAVLYAVNSTIWTILLIPYAIVSAILGWIFVVVSYFCETVIVVLHVFIMSLLSLCFYLFILDLQHRKQALDSIILKYECLHVSIPIIRQHVVESCLSIRDTLLTCVHSVGENN